ncbi:MAG: helix-turn-helix domain-containing protein [Streptomyces sp.]|nr:helix-turn-helix domain-containing protein [Streptomyces sp.]NUR42003.1 helix-turn-helix domain-containing protein [Streptomyces sp.]NUS12447.1 helix-turn-helix domain-containing protein [Streptomyces sp.]NUS30322.1 helix-turn-helix domain-containing protein [Streptomyces sp.]NUS76437.1 helix-turn-helix domain-containing protein [Streptomyces sp.]
MPGRSGSRTVRSRLRGCVTCRRHPLLLAASPDSKVTVADVAARWGLLQPSRFAAHYRTAYGVNPAVTLNAEPQSTWTPVA